MRLKVLPPLLGFGKMYNIIYADPPWAYKDNASAGKRGAVYKYPCLSLPGISALDVRAIAAKDCLLAMWWTGPLAAEALAVVAAWGFKLKTAFGFVWHKTSKNGNEHLGMGHWTRANVEACLFAVRGKPKRASASVRQFVDAPIGRHSEKPAVVRDRLVELMGDVPRVELFARESTPGWDAWGDEVDCAGTHVASILSTQ